MKGEIALHFAATAFGKIASSQQWSSWLNAKHVLTHEDLLEHKEFRKLALQFTSVLKDNNFRSLYKIGDFNRNMGVSL